MTPPRICPTPPDCPLYTRRLDYGVDEPLRRAVLSEQRRPSMAELVWTDFNRQYRRPEGSSLPTRPEPQRPMLPVAADPLPLPISDFQKGSRQ